MRMAQVSQLIRAPLLAKAYLTAKFQFSNFNSYRDIYDWINNTFVILTGPNTKFELFSLSGCQNMNQIQYLNFPL